MKILRVFGVVVGIHVLAFLFLLTSPGCSSTSKPAPTASDTVVPSESSPATVSVPSGTAGSSAASPITSAPLNTDASATVSFNSATSGGVRYTPTRPGTSAAVALEAQPVADVTPATTYVVVSGDNLTVVARKNKLTVAELAGANNLRPNDKLHVGQKLIILAKAPTASTAGASSSSTASHDSPAAATGTKSGADEQKHTVKAGETLEAIAKKYGVKQSDLGVRNNITDPKKIRPGQELIIPAAKASKASSKPAAANSTTSATHAAAVPATATPATKPAAEAKPLFNIPPPGQDLDAGLKSAPANDVPVIKVVDDPSAKKP